MRWMSSGRTCSHVLSTRLAPVRQRSVLLGKFCSRSSSRTASRCSGISDGTTGPARNQNLRETSSLLLLDDSATNMGDRCSHSHSNSARCSHNHGRRSQCIRSAWVRLLCIVPYCRQLVIIACRHRAVKQGQSEGFVCTNSQGKGRVGEVRVGQAGRGRAQGGERPPADEKGQRKGQGEMARGHEAPPASDSNPRRHHATPPPLCSLSEQQQVLFLQLLEP